MAVGKIGDHGGSLERARRLFPDAPAPFVDLSTGINPNPYPLFDLPATAFTRLPEQGRQNRLVDAAVAAYGAPSALNAVAAPGTQILLPLVMGLVAPGRAMILGPTYAEHARAAHLAGHRVEDARSLDALGAADLAVAVNPNNPDGRVCSRAELLHLADRLSARGGLLVVDEAFMDVGPKSESVAADAGRPGLVVLKSFGKFHGLAGIRLGFAIAHTSLAQRLGDLLGPWAVSGPALEIGIRALEDTAWRDSMLIALAEQAARLDALLSAAGFGPVGGTPLFRYIETADAQALFGALGRRGILVRSFAWSDRALRLGLPGGEDAWQRLDEALRSYKGGRVA
ncbi:MAG: threonine-phosphate decarboxylase [Rhizobiaceae bacterium]|nr:threonine-phosphate decarboxylase [Rhizobiaceae bacterium]